jgi:hypothetical protein
MKLMVTKYLLLFSIFTLPVSSFSQNSSGKIEKSFYAFYGRHYTTRYYIDSGQSNLVGRKYNESVEAGLNIDYPINDQWMIRTGINGHLLLLGEITYGIDGPVPPGVIDPFVHQYARGIDYVESVTIGFPIKIRYNLLNTEEKTVLISGGPFIGVYFPAADEMAGSARELSNGTILRDYWVTRHFKNYKSNKSLGISYPQLEWDFDIEGKKYFKKYGAISLGIKTHIGTRRLEKATFDIFPTEPSYRSKGHFILNRSYIGLYSAFTFGKNR